MITFDSGGALCETLEDLPSVPASVRVLYADFETSSGHPKLKATNPWRNCAAICCGVAFDDSPVWCVPKHLLVTGWWRDCLFAAQSWCNHHVKFDAHVSANDLTCPPPEALELSCTLNDAKLLNSDMGFGRGGYGLDNLAKAWLSRDIDEYGRRMVPYLQESMDYGDVPLDVLAEYCCVDVDTTRRLAAYIAEKLPPESRNVQRTEHQVTRLLYETEQRGVRVDPLEVKKTEMRTLIRMCELDAQVDREVGRPFTMNSNKDCYDVLVNQYGLPVLAWTEPNEETGKPANPSFDADALKLYSQYPGAPEGLIVKMLEYRKLGTFRGLFLEKFDELADAKGIVHATYNQSVRTGRMSCSDPNLQQLDEMAKQLIIPPEGYGMVVCDASQIELRFIVHYTDNAACKAAYLKDPWVDFHKHTSDRGGILRAAGKTLNFAVGFGQGKRKTIAQMSINKEFVGTVEQSLDLSELREESRRQAVRMACEQKATGIYQWYHAEFLPELKTVSKAAERAALQRGWVKNWSGRRRYLQPEQCRRAFPSLCQSSAGDLVKDRMVALRKDVPEFQMIAQVHDELVGIMPLELLQREERTICEKIVSVLNDPADPISVPIRWTIGRSSKNWAHAKSKEREQKLF